MRVAAGASIFAFIAACGSSHPSEGGGPGPRVSTTSSIASSSGGATIDDAPPAVAPGVFEGLIAIARDEMTAATTEQARRALARTAFVLLREPATIPPDAKARTYIVARDAAFDAIDDGRAPGAQPFTALWPSGAACVGHAERKVVMRTNRESSGPPDVARGLMLEGCDAPPGVYGMFIVSGAHPDARRRSPSPVAASATPAWATGAASASAFRFDGAEPLFVVMAEGGGGPTGVAWQVGSATAAYGVVDLQVTAEPVLLEVDGDVLLVGGGAVVEVRGGALRRR